MSVPCNTSPNLTRGAGTRLAHDAHGIALSAHEMEVVKPLCSFLTAMQLTGALRWTHGSDAPLKRSVRGHMDILTRYAYVDGSDFSDIGRFCQVYTELE
jgi:hypothetical protein